MAARIIRLLGFMLIASGSAGSLWAGCWDDVTDCFHSIPRDIKRRQCWPEPFNAPDRAAVRAPFATMVANGWRRQNLLGDYYFESNTGKLKEAGTLKVRWILAAAPQPHRIIYVRVAGSEEATSARIAAVQEQVALMVPKGSLVPVLPTTISDDGWPADEVETIARTYLKSTPVPRLPAAASTSNGNGNSSGGTNN